MTRRLLLAPLAERDLFEIANYISRENMSATHQALLRLERTIDLLLERPFPGSAVTRPTRTGLRRMTVAPYIIFYRVVGDALQVVRVLHSSRDLDEELAVD